MSVSRPDPRSATPLARVTFCVLDLETTGTDPGWDEITEVGAILVRGGERLGTFHTLVGPGHAGIDGVLPSLVDFIGDAVITGHNISFDIRFLDAALARAERPLLDSSDVVDTMYLARALLRDDADDCRLGTLAARFEFEHRPSHRAFEDAAATVDLLHLLIERSSAFGVVGLDDLCALPTLAGHKWAAKLRHTASLPREPGVFTCLDDRGQVVWVGEAGDLRRDVRQLFSRAGSAVHASVLRDTCGWEVRHVASPLARAVARQRLLHAHRPRLQRREVMGDAAVFVQVASTSRSVKATVVRSATTTGFHLGPISDRATAAAAVACIRRLAGAGAGADMIAMLADAADGRPEPLERALVELASTTPDDPVDAALLRRDRQALLDLLAAHRRVRTARSFTGELEATGHRVAIASGLLLGDDLPPVTATALDDDHPLHGDLLAEVLLVADLLDGGMSDAFPPAAAVRVNGA